MRRLLLSRSANGMASPMAWCNTNKVWKIGAWLMARSACSSSTSFSNGPEIACDMYTQDDHFMAMRNLLSKMGLTSVDENDLAAYWVTQLISKKFLDCGIDENKEVLDHINSVK